MMSGWFLAGASFLALIADICCLPVNQDINWAVAPPSISPAVTEMSAENVSPPGPDYQEGELSQFEQTSETGVYQMATEKQGFHPPLVPFMPSSTGQGSTKLPYMGGIWLPYPYDYMFMTGQYPPGLYSHYSNSQEQGSDNWQDVHHMGDSAPYSQGQADEYNLGKGRGY